ncbi:uncharacterized protein N7477_003441 [Penicillium maclennaniae]|uniref:uncharacterized protein n=1 Tax=Penicillium maclennaniae TaxID=1343394 RepID=UPI0025403DE1|nr:uncharacterized protein N7477_003441 [Penicillium maclennaniae]KAJ5677808.1 hypothetical protein N7477_003441 [Penicillium maclennaniae]
MHTSYLSLAVFALAAVAAPSMSKPNSDPFANSFPFITSGSSSVTDGDDDGMSNSIPSYMEAMEAVESARGGSYNTPQPTSHAAPQMLQVPSPAAKPEPQPEAQQAAPKPEPAKIPAPAANVPKVQTKPETKETVPLADAVENPVKEAIPAILAAPVAALSKSSPHAKTDIVSSVIAEAMGQTSPEADPTEDVPELTQAPVTIEPVLPSQVAMSSPSVHSSKAEPKAIAATSSSMVVPKPTSSSMATPSAMADPELASTPMAASSSPTGPTPTSTMSSFISKASPSPTHRPLDSTSVHEDPVSSSELNASPSSSGSVSASATPSAKAGLLGLGGVVDHVPMVGSMLGPLIGG